MPEENLHAVEDPDGLLVGRARRGDMGHSRGSSSATSIASTRSPLDARLCEEAEDAVQEAWLRAWRDLPRFRGGARFSTWLYRIC